MATLQNAELSLFSLFLVTSQLKKDKQTKKRGKKEKYSVGKMGAKCLVDRVKWKLLLVLGFKIQRGGGGCLIDKPW